MGDASCVPFRIDQVIPLCVVVDRDNDGAVARQLLLGLGSQCVLNLKAPRILRRAEVRNHRNRYAEQEV